MSVVANVAINVDATKALGQLKAVDQASKGLDSGLKGAAGGAKGFGAALQSALGPLLAVSTAVTAVQKSLSVAFERGAAEQRLKNLSSSTGEYQAALASAASTSEKFGISQTEATTALADVYGRLKGVGFGLKETTEIYEGFNVVAKQSGLSASDAAGTFFQLSQALGKGKLNGDEFVSVAERMPQLLDAIAAETGRSRGELAGMAQEGKISSDVLYRALARSAGAAGDLNGKLTDQQKAFNSLRTVADTLLNTIGKVFAPFVIKGAELLAVVGQKIAEWWDYLGKNVLPRIMTALSPLITEFEKLWSQIPWETIVGYLQGAILVSVNRITKAVEFLAPIVALVISKFAELARNPVFKFIAEQVGRLANMLGISSQEVANFTAKQKEAQQAVAATANQYSSMPDKIKDSKEAAAELKLEVQGVRNTFAALNAEQEQLIASIDGSLKIAEARHQAESAIRDVIKDQLKDQLDQAATQQDRIKIAKKIYDIEIANAKSALKLALQRIDAEVDRVNIAIKTQELKLQELDVEMRILRSRKQNTSEIEGAIASQRNALNIAISTARTVEEIARYQSQSAMATFNSQRNAAALAFQQNIVARNTNAAASAAGQFASQMERGAAAANAVYRRPGVNRTLEDVAASIGTLGRTSTQTRTLSATEARRLGVTQSVTPFATGGVVTKPTLGLVGEAGTEYIVPEAKAASFAANYLSGARGEAALNTTSSIPTINIQTGPVMQQDGQRYVTISDLEGAMQQVADTLLNSGRTAGGRRFAGVR